MKKIALYLMTLIIVLGLIWLADEGDSPLVLKGTDLEQSAGVSDYTGLIGIDETAAYYGLFAIQILLRIISLRFGITEPRSFNGIWRKRAESR